MNTSLTAESILELIRKTTSYLPGDVTRVLEKHYLQENKHSRGNFALDLILQNIQLARQDVRPLCQDTGYLSFYVDLPIKSDPVKFEEAIKDAVVEATKLGYLRQNSVDCLTGKNEGSNMGPGMPDIHYNFGDDEGVTVRLIQKGGGCENRSAQYKLPWIVKDQIFNRDLEGVRACILDAVYQAQGKGCGPGFLGVCIGGDRASGYKFAKEQLLRTVDDVNPNPRLAELETKIVEEANTLDIGPMGFGGKFTLGGCKIGALNRLPASFFVSIAYMCWAYRRRGVYLDNNGIVKEWLYQSPGEFENTHKKVSITLPRVKDIKHLNTPLTNEVQSLNVGDVVMINGTLFTGRDAVHKYLYEGGNLNILHNAVFYHCGPIMKKEGGQYIPLAAGPTTSIREEPYEADIIKRFGLKAVIGKGGMGNKTLKACQVFGAVYLHAIGGAAQIYARTIKKVVSVHLEEFGSPEAVWELEVENFPAIVTMDAHGNSLHEDIRKASEEKLRDLLNL